ncbi:transcriptional regulator, CopG family [Alkalithermobacter thermoalcaliphilus JW-YL-7 = DSM 7308]|uniref:Transcriptional regulator, CopG family n=1 Tax=Alkalithermobacter thermoalcaliphilus JW-YL-7 = DSM 7308 TaxID=1121328 RepID=A0A150FSD5_CLOPD|nr:putative transcriptional regulator, CopG family [[Clostridium] paradoxum JW-YL-7 = DSM 7308]SHK72316.1 transcriptional regulator, CopG family [[Clostridium] paradoxum JW-YL-7 = DSM 7308]
MANSNQKKILVSLPNSLLQEIDRIIEVENKNRSEFIKEAMKLYLREKRKVETRETMIKGYREMGVINLALAEMGLSMDVSSLEGYEGKMAEGE